MRAFHNDPKVKKTYLSRIMAHAKADEIIKGRYWENGKGCAVGCTIHSSNHNTYETELGIPEWLARVEDTLFEGMPDKDAKTWPSKFLQAIKPGVNLNKARIPFLVVILNDTLKSMNSAKFDSVRFPNVVKSIEESKKAVNLMIKAQKSGNKNLISQASSAADSAYWAARAAYLAADSAYSASWAAARSAADSAYLAADSAAHSAASSARSAADSAYLAADSAYWAADSARSAADSAYWAARAAADSAAYKKYADALIKILKSIK